MQRIVWRAKRTRARCSLEQAAVAAGVTTTTARLFELGGPSAIFDQRKREALIRVYRGFEHFSHGDA